MSNNKGKVTIMEIIYVDLMDIYKTYSDSLSGVLADVETPEDAMVHVDVLKSIFNPKELRQAFLNGFPMMLLPCNIFEIIDDENREKGQLVLIITFQGKAYLALTDKDIVY